MRWSVLIFFFMSQVAFAQADMALMIARMNPQMAPAYLPPIYPVTGGYSFPNFGGYGGGSNFMMLGQPTPAPWYPYQMPSSSPYQGMMYPGYNGGGYYGGGGGGGGSSFLGSVMSFLPGAMNAMFSFGGGAGGFNDTYSSSGGGSSYCYSCSSSRRSSSLDYIDVNRSSQRVERDSDTEASLSHERFGGGKSDDRRTKNPAKEKLAKADSDEDDKGESDEDGEQVHKHDDDENGKGLDLAIGADVDIGNGQKLRVQLTHKDRPKNNAQRAPIWKSFISNFQSCAPVGCEPAQYGTFRSGGGRSCHHGGYAIDLGAMICNGRTYKAINRGKFATMAACMRKKMRTLYWQPLTRGKNITTAHHDHAHFSNGCSERMY